MDWVHANQNMQTCLSSLGSLVGDTYCPSPTCLDVLKEIYQKLLSEDKVTRAFRRAIHFSQGLQNDIVPLLISSNDKEIISAVVRILACLLVPVECLLPLEIMSQTEVGRIVVFELKSFLVKSKTVFQDARSTGAILDFIKANMTFDSDSKTVDSQCETINNCLLVLRNVLHIPEHGRIHKNLQNHIVWNLFVQNIDQILLHLLTHKKKAYWSVAIVQLIAVLYKDQHVGTLQKLLHVWFEGSMSDSSEDNESNTTPDQRSASSPVMTSSELNSSDSSEGSGKACSTHEGSSGVPHVSTRSPQAGSSHDSAIPSGKMLAFEESASDRKSPGGVAARRGNTGNVESAGRGTWEDESGHGSISSKAQSVQHHRTTQRTKPSSSSSSSSTDLPKKMECSSPQEFSDYGYGSHVGTPEAVSTSSNEEESSPTKRPFHQKPHIQKTRYCNKQPSPQEKKEVRRRKLMKRSRTTLMNIKAMAGHVPRDEDITHVLKEFTVGFLLTGYEPLVTALHTELLTPSSGLPIDTSHFFWLLTYFLKFAGQLELDIEQVRGVLSFGVLSYLVYEGVSISEHVEQTVHVDVDADVKASLRRQHLVVTAIREFVLSLETYDKVNYLSPQDKEDLRELRNLISSCTDLKCLFVLMLRLYRPDVHSRQYLEDLVVTNHILLSFLEHQNEANSKQIQALPGSGKSVPPISEHLKQFATVDMMKHYGLLLEDFHSNGEFINDCVFTMMHHIGGEMNCVATLCQPNILKTFTQIWETDFELCEDWSDLTEYVIHSVVNLPRQCPFVDVGPASPEDAGWSKEECENLPWYFSLSVSGSDLIANIIKLYKENGVTKTRTGVTERLFKQGVISEEQYKQLIDDKTQCGPGPATATAIATSIDSEMTDEISSLRDVLLIDGLGEQVSWLQRLLLDTRHAKLVLRQNPAEKQNYPCEPVPYYYSMQNQSIPLVTWNCDLSAAVRNRTYQCLLRQLGFHLPSETGKLFYRIPSFWTPDILLSIALKLGPVDPSLLRSIEETLENGADNVAADETKKMDMCLPFAVHRAKNSSSLVNYTPVPNIPATNWLDVVKKSKTAVMDLRDPEEPVSKPVSEAEDLECASVLSVCDTQASDLTRMCISDEDEEGNPLPDWC